MGCVISTNKDAKKTDTNMLNIYSYNVGINNIKHIKDLVLNDDTIDVICLQNFHDIKDITDFIRFVNRFNKTTKKRFEIYPNSISNEKKRQDANTIHIAWSYGLGDEHQDVDGLIISRHPIVTSSKIKINNTMFDTHKYFYLVNILFHGSIISIFNVVLQPNFTGILNNKTRSKQIEELFGCITENANNYKNTNITLICGNINIEEYMNNSANTEYIDMMRKFNGLDTYRYVMTMKHKDDITKYMIRNDYIIIVVDDIHFANKHEDFGKQMQYISELLYNNKNAYISNSFSNNMVNTTITIKNKKINEELKFKNICALELE
jgi:hypothetical protein